MFLWRLTVATQMCQGCHFFKPLQTPPPPWPSIAAIGVYYVHRCCFYYTETSLCLLTKGKIQLIAIWFSVNVFCYCDKKLGWKKRKGKTPTGVVLKKGEWLALPCQKRTPTKRKRVCYLQCKAHSPNCHLASKDTKAGHNTDQIFKSRINVYKSLFPIDWIFHSGNSIKDAWFGPYQTQLSS